MDIAISNWIINTFQGNRAFAQIACIFSWIGSKWVIITLLLFLMCFRRTRKMSIITLTAVLITFMLNDLVLKEIIHRERPYTQDSNLSMIMDQIGYAHPTGFSMPSGHSAVAMACAVGLLCFSKKFGIVAIILAVFIGLSRVCLCAHYFTDVLVGFAFGAAVALLVYYISKMIIKKFKGAKKES